jgi:hypothetical protein
MRARTPCVDGDMVTGEVSDLTKASRGAERSLPVARGRSPRHGDRAPAYRRLADAMAAPFFEEPPACRQVTEISQRLVPVLGRRIVRFISL